MPNPATSTKTTDASEPWPGTMQEAIDCLLGELGQAEKNQIAERPVDDLASLHFGLGAKIRHRFGLWQGNPLLLSECQKAKCARSPSEPGGMPASIHPDDASMVIIHELWLRLRSDRQM